MASSRNAAGDADSCCRRSRPNGTGIERTFVEQTCHKAGLPRDAWRHGATLWKFEAEVFSEGR